MKNYLYFFVLSAILIFLSNIVFSQSEKINWIEAEMLEKNQKEEKKK